MFKIRFSQEQLRDIYRFSHCIGGSEMEEVTVYLLRAENHHSLQKLERQINLSKTLQNNFVASCVVSILF